jgi:hypothetical protein
MLSPHHLEHVCLVFANDQSQTCRYLKQDSDVAKCYCRKLVVKDREKIDDKVNAFLKLCKSSNVDPRDQNVPLGDNCPGYPFLLYKSQGYDVDGN